METAGIPPAWDPDAAAAAVLRVIGEVVEDIGNPLWKGAAQAALRQPAEQYLGHHGDSLAQRFKRRAELDRARPFRDQQEANAAKDAYRGYWTACAGKLAAAVERRLEQMARERGAWEHIGVQAPPAPPLDLPIGFLRTDVLYSFSGRVGTRSTSYRWVVANDSVDHYDAVGWYYNEPDAPVEIVPVANCLVTAGMRDLPAGGRTARLDFSKVLEKGERYFFAYSTIFNSSRPCRPAIMYEVRGSFMDALVVRVQFDVSEIPALCWYFDVEDQNEGWQEPDGNADEVLEVSANGYVDHEFVGCRRGRKYGLRWRWSAE